MPDTISVGVLTHAGGAHLELYFQGLAAAENCGAVSLADPDGPSAEVARRVLGDKLKNVYRDHAELLAREKPALALVSMEAALAPPVIERALEAGCHVLSEKPACVRVEQFEPLARKADSKHLHLMLALANRLSPPIQAAKKLIRDGMLGTVYGVEAHIIADQTRLAKAAYHESWYAHKSRAGGGHLIWLGIHWLDLAEYISGGLITDVTGFVSNVGGQPLDVEDAAVVSLKFDNGALGTLTSGYYLPEGYNTHVKVWGSRGWLHLEPHEEVPLRWRTSAGGKLSDVEAYSGDGHPRTYTPMVQAAVRAAAGLAPPPITAAEGLHVLRTVYAYYEASSTGASRSVS